MSEADRGDTPKDSSSEGFEEIYTIIEGSKDNHEVL